MASSRSGLEKEEGGGVGSAVERHKLRLPVVSVSQEMAIRMDRCRRKDSDSARFGTRAAAASEDQISERGKALKGSAAVLLHACFTGESEDLHMSFKK